MLGLGLASSHAPMMFQKAQYWPRVVERIPEEAREHLPQSARVGDRDARHHRGPHPEDRGRPRGPARPAPGLPAGRADHDRRRPGRHVRRRQQPDLLDLHRRGAASGAGARATATTPRRQERTKLVFRQHAELSRHLLQGPGQARLRRGQHRALRSARQPDARRLAHGLEPRARGGPGAATSRWSACSSTSTYPPLPSAARCAQLGAAIADA